MDRFGSIVLGDDGVVKDLSIAHNPESETHHKEGSPFQDAQRTLIKFIVKHRRFLIEISNASLFNCILYGEIKECNWKQQRHSQPIHEGHEDDIHN